MRRSNGQNGKEKQGPGVLVVTLHKGQEGAQAPLPRLSHAGGGGGAVTTTARKATAHLRSNVGQQSLQATDALTNGLTIPAARGE